MADKPFQVNIDSFSTLNSFEKPRALQDGEMPECLGFIPLGKTLRTTPTMTAIQAIPNISNDVVRAFSIYTGAIFRYFLFDLDGKLHVYDENWNQTDVLTDFSNPQFAVWFDYSLLIIDKKAGYWICTGVTFTRISDIVVGDAIAVYQGRVFIANGKTITWSVGGSYSDFSGIGAGAFQDEYGSIQPTISKLITIQDTLYAIGQSGIHLISLVTENYYHAVEAMSGVNPQYPDCINTYQDKIFFNDSKSLLHVVSGSGIQTNNIPITANFPSSNVFGTYSFISFIYDIPVYCMSAVHDNKKMLLCNIIGSDRWFWVPLSDSTIDITAIVNVSTGSIQNSPIAFYTDRTNGVTVYAVKLFDSFDSPVTRIIQTKSYSLGSIIKDKQINRAGVQIVIDDDDINKPALLPSITILSDFNSETEAISQPPKGNDGNIFLATQFTSPARGKSVAVYFEDVSTQRQYSVTGFSIEGIVGSDW